MIPEFDHGEVNLLECRIGGIESFGSFDLARDKPEPFL
jgi:hypothetical protein